MSDRWSGCVGEGWYQELVLPFLEAISTHPDVQVSDIKEKWGELVLSVAGPGWAQQLAEALENYSRSVCEQCGRHHGWIRGSDRYPAIVSRNRVGWVKSLCQYCRPTEEGL